MWGTLLIGFYLIRDTIYRWMTRVSSPLSRLSVVFFLSLCGLIFLSSYVISIKVLRQRIHSNGADLVVVSEFVRDGAGVHRAGHNLIPFAPDEYELYLFHEPYLSATIGKQHFTLVEYMPGCTGLFPQTNSNGVYLLPNPGVDTVLPEEVSMDGYVLRAVTIPERQAGFLRRVYHNGAVFIPYGSLSNIWKKNFSRRSIIRMKSPSADQALALEQAVRLMAKLDKRPMGVMSSAKLLKELGQLTSSQYSFRVGITVGISSIICLLLTSISSLEFRDNRFVYALIGSFGISRMALFLSFILENTVLVALGFATSLAVLWGVRDYITAVLYKSPDITLTLWELEADILTFCLAFGICILVSSIPIGIAACRPIGKVLK